MKVETGHSPGWELDLRGRWARSPTDELIARVSGTLRGPGPGPGLAEPAAGTVTVRPIRLPGGLVIGSRRIAIDVTAGERRLLLDRDPGPPPYLMGITLSGRLSDPAADDEDVKVWIHPAQVLDLWLRMYV